MIRDIEITDRQFNLAVEKGSKNPEYQAAFNQLRIVEDYQSFKKFLKKRSLELEAELEELKGRNKEESKNEEEDLEAAIKESLAYADSIQQKREIEQEEEELLLKQAMLQSQVSYENEVKKNEDDKVMEEAMMVAKRLERRKKHGDEARVSQELHVGKLIKQGESQSKEKTSFKIKSKTVEKVA
jgi:hypothetical protein